MTPNSEETWQHAKAEAYYCPAAMSGFPILVGEQSLGQSTVTRIAL